MTRSPKELAAADKAHIWHPFTQMSSWLASDPLVIDRAEGFYLIDADGNRYLDGVSSLWVNVHGHGVKEIDDAIRDQLERVSHSTFLGLTNTPAIELAELLVAGAPKGLEKVFYSESGASAVEVAIKMAFQYWQLSGRPSKQRFVSFENAYHGDTIGTVSVGGIDTFHETFRPMLFPTFRAASPYCYRCPLGLEFPSCQIACLESLSSILEEHSVDIAAVILEPAVQAAGGMITAPPGHLARVRRLCDEHDVLLILDEVAVGVGRTGTMWASEREMVTPDLMATGKGLTGGTLPLSVTFTTKRIFDAFANDTFFHGHSYSGNPLACAAAIANLKLIESTSLLGDVRRKAANLADFLAPLRALPHVGDIRQRGLMTGIELVADKATKEPFDPAERMGAQVCKRARSDGVIIRPLGDVVVLMPPPAMPDDLLEQLVKVARTCIEEITGA